MLLRLPCLGLLQRGKRVTVIIDAVGSHDKYAADVALRQMQAKGARIIGNKVDCRGQPSRNTSGPAVATAVKAFSKNRLTNSLYTSKP